jgi:hypothetical protein
MTVGVLGVLMFIWGFVPWFNVGDAETERKFSGYAFHIPATAVIGFSLATGMIAAFGATERRVVVAFRAPYQRASRRRACCWR